VLPPQPENTESSGHVFPEQLIAHLAELVWDAPDNIVDITALEGSSLNGHHPASYFTDSCFSFSNDRDLECWATGISRAQRRLVKTIELKSSWEIWVNTEIPLPDNTFQVEMEALWDIDGLFYTVHLDRFESLEKVHPDLSYTMPWHRKSDEDIRTAQQTPKAERDRNYNAMHTKFNKRITTFVEQVLDNEAVKVTYRILELGNWEEPTEQATQSEEVTLAEEAAQSEEATQSRRTQPSRKAAVLGQEERRRSVGSVKKK
jgi:hypothetical protein